MMRKCIGKFVGGKQVILACISNHHASIPAQDIADNKHELSELNVDSLFISAPKKSRYHWGTGVENLKKTTSATGTNTSIKQWALVTNRTGQCYQKYDGLFWNIFFSKKGHR